MEVVWCVGCGMEIFGDPNEDTQCSKCEENDALKYQVRQLTGLNLWSARRLHSVHKEFAYKELEKITGQEHERL